MSVDIHYEHTHLAAKAQTLSLEIALPLHHLHAKSCARYSLIYTDEYLGLKDHHHPSMPYFYIDFLSQSWRYRIRKATMKNEFIAKAMGTSPQIEPRILDLTAGLGRDSYLLASLGYTVTLLERSPVVFALLRDALQRAEQDEQSRKITARMHLIHADAHHYLPGKTADIIYLDPMFPTRQKSALVKKELSILQALLGHDEDKEALLNLAISCAVKRVVVKRPRLAAPLSRLFPQFSYEGKSSRFDIYLISPKTGTTHA